MEGWMYTRAEMNPDGRYLAYTLGWLSSELKIIWNTKLKYSVIKWKPENYFINQNKLLSFSVLFCDNVMGWMEASSQTLYPYKHICMNLHNKVNKGTSRYIEVFVIIIFDIHLSPSCLKFSLVFHQRSMTERSNFWDVIF